MNLLDMRTLLFSYLITTIICVWFVVQLWLQNRNRFTGTAFWVVAFVFQAAALILIALRGTIPDWISMIFSNTLVIVGAILGFVGLERFFEKKGSQIQNYLLVVLFIFVHSYFALVQPNLAVRNLNIAVALLLICFQSVWLAWHRLEPNLRPLAFWVGLVYFLYCLASSARIANFFVVPHLDNDYFQPVLFEALVLVSYQMLMILLTYSFVMMVNKRLLREVRMEEEKFTKVFQFSPYAIMLTRLSDGAIIDVSESFCSISGYDRSEVMGKEITGLEIWENRKDRAAFVEELSRASKIKGKELRFRKKDGEAVTGLVSAESILIDGEKCILSSIADITEHKRAEEEVLRLKQKDELILSSVAEGILGLDLRGGHTFVNRAAARMLGYEAEELLGLPSHGTWHHIKPDGSAYPEADCQILGAHRDDVIPSVTTEVFWRKDGTSFPVEYVSAPAYSQGCISGFTVAFFDITERKRAEILEHLSGEVLDVLNRSGDSTLAIRNILLLIQKSLDFKAVGIRLKTQDDFPYYEPIGFSDSFIIAEKYLCSHDEKGNIVREEQGNPFLECMCGNVIKQRIDTRQPFFTKSGSFWTNSTTDLLASTTQMECQTCNRNRCNTEGYESVALIPLRTDNEIIGLLQLNDHRRDLFTLTEIHYLEELGNSIGIALTRRQAENVLRKNLRRLQETKNMLIQSEKMAAIGTLAAGVTHEILNPLNIISLYLQMLDSDAISPEKIKQVVDICQQQVERIVKISKDLNQFARVGSNEIALMNINHLLEQTFSLITPKLRVNKVMADLQLGSDLPSIPMDKSNLGQVFLNLVNNALDAMEAVPEKTLRVTTELVTVADSKFIRVVFADNGTGIPEEAIFKIFDPFFTTKEPGKGTGLGLSVTLRIIQDHGGNIRVENNEWGGASFFIDMPVHAPSGSTSSQESES